MLFRSPAWSLRQDLNLAGLIDLWRRTDEELASFIGDTAMTRAGVKGLRRNIAVALGNSGDRGALDVLDHSETSGTFSDPLVLDHVRWAKRKLADSTGRERS